MDQAEMDLSELPGVNFQRHPWEVVRARFFCHVLRPVLQAKPNATVLDFGAGDAYLAGALLAKHPGAAVTCFDPGYETVSPGQFKKRPHGIEFTRTEPPGDYDVMLLLDVIEHIENDEVMLSRLVRDHVRPSGYVLFSVPAWPWLFSNHDLRLGHFRRYTPGSAAALLAAAGLQIVEQGGLFHSPLLVRAVSVAGERRRPREGTGDGPGEHSLRWRSGRLSWHVAVGLLRADSSLSIVASRAGIDLPGLSWWALCRRS